MIHATQSTLARLEPLLASIRAFKVLKEKSRGVFYYKSKAFLHFHEDAARLFADVRAADQWCRYPVTEKRDQANLLATVTEILSQMC